MKKLIYSVVALLAMWSCSDDDNVTAKPDIDITGEVTNVVQVKADLTVSLSTDKACYKPGETVTFTATGTIPADAKVRYRNGSEVVDEQAAGGQTWTWTAPDADFTGYLVDVYRTAGDGSETVLGTIGVDVSSDWTRFPRYGFVATFDASKTADGDMTGPARSLPTDMAVISEGTVVDELADKTKLVPELQAKETQVVPGLQPRRKGVFKVRYQGMELPMVVLPPAGSYTLGRKSSDSTARIKVAPDIRMSRVHAGMRTVVANGGTNNYQITSLKDDNPVYVNGRPVQEYTIGAAEGE